MHYGDDETIELIGQLYDAACEPALWPEVLVRLADAVGGAQVCMFDCDPATHSAVLIAPRHDPDYVDRFDRFLPSLLRSQAPELGRRLVEAPAGEVIDGRHLVALWELEQSEFYQEWWRPQQLSLVTLGAKWTVEPQGWGFCSVHHPADVGEFDSAASRLFGLLSAHIARAGSLHHRLRHAEFELQAAAQLGFDRLTETGVIFIDRMARVVHANAVASELLRAGDGLTVTEGVLDTTGAGAGLGRLIAGCAGPQTSGNDPGGATTVARQGRLPLHVKVAPVACERWRDRGAWLSILQPAAVLVVRDPELERRNVKTRLQQRFTLTPAEADVAIEIGRGDGRRAAAARLALSPGTVRIHLQRIFDKTGTHRQAELVRVVAEAGGPAGWQGLASAP